MKYLLLALSIVWLAFGLAAILVPHNTEIDRLGGVFCLVGAVVSLGFGAVLRAIEKE